MQDQSTEKKAYTTPTLTTHGDVVKVTEITVIDGSTEVVSWRPRQFE